MRWLTSRNLAIPLIVLQGRSPTSRNLGNPLVVTTKERSDVSDIKESGNSSRRHDKSRAEEKGGAGDAPQAPQGDSSQMGMMFIFLFTMIIMFNPGLRAGMGSAMGSLLYPLIGFEGSYPVITILFASLITGTLSVIGRHYFTDWIQMGKTQTIQKALGKEMRAAQLKNDVAKLTKLREYQMKMSKEQMGSMSSQMKPTMYMMIVFIAIFTWLWIFIGALPDTTLSLPWNCFTCSSRCRTARRSSTFLKR